MKKLLVVSLLTAVTATVFGQGAITWNNNFTGNFRAPIYNVDPTNPGTEKTGQSAFGTPTGTTVYNGGLLQGTGYTVGFFAGPSAGSLSLLGTTTLRTAATEAMPAGLFASGGTVTVAGVLPGQSALFQFRVWDNKGGTVTDWGQASALWMTQAGYAAGMSALVTSAGLGGIDPNSGAPLATPNTTGWTSFQLTAAPIPEPSTFALAGLAGAALLIFRRRK